MYALLVAVVSVLALVFCVTEFHRNDPRTTRLAWALAALPTAMNIINILKEHV